MAPPPRPSDELSTRLEDTSGDLATIGEELFAVTAVLRSEAAVRRIATDASIEGDAKAGLMDNLFANTLGADALDLVKDAVKRRWTGPRDLADVIEYLGVLATVRSAGDEGGRISDELFEVRRNVDAHAELRSTLSDPARSTADKRGLLDQLLEGKVQKATLLLVGQAVSGSHGNVDRGLEEFQHIAAEAKQEKIATVRTARRPDRQRARPADAGTVPAVRHVGAPAGSGGPRCRRRPAGPDRRRRHRRHRGQQAR